MNDEIPSDKILVVSINGGPYRAFIWFTHNMSPHHCAAKKEHKTQESFGYQWAGDTPEEAVKNLRCNITTACIDLYMGFPRMLYRWGGKTAEELGL